MTKHKVRSCHLRAALAAGASAIAIALSPAALAQPSSDQVYILRSASEVADGAQVLSASGDMLMARHREGDHSLLVYDVQNGAIVSERGGETVVAPLISHRGAELSFAYDYGSGQLKGDAGTASVFNTWLRPAAAMSPSGNQDANWALATDLRALGIVSAGPAPLGFKLNRTHHLVDGRPVILLEYEIPAFHYRAPGGESVVHWARGFAVVDSEYGQVFAKGMQHRASASSADGRIRPISVRSSMHGIEADGGWSLGFQNSPAIRAALQRVTEVSGDHMHPVAASDDKGEVDPFPGMLAAYLDIAALAIAEGGANPLPVTSGAGSSPQVLLEQLGQTAGTSSATMLETLGLDLQRPVDPTVIQALAEYIANPGTELPAGLEDEVNVQVYHLTASGSILPNTNSGGGEPGNPRQGLNSYAADALSATLMMMAPGSASYSLAKSIATELTPEQRDQFTFLAAQLTQEPPTSLFDQRAALASTTSDALSATLMMMMPGSASYNLAKSITTELTPEQRERLILLEQQLTTRTVPNTAEELDALVSQMVREQETQRQTIEQSGQMIDMINQVIRRDHNLVDDAIDSLRGALPADQYDAFLSQLTQSNDPRLQDANLQGIVDIPGWMESNSLEADNYRRLVEELKLKADEIRGHLDTQTDKQKEVELANDGGFGENEDFYENNAFHYTSMVGIVPTDLSRWSQWLATQNVRELERLARLIGYPNLASALADAENIIRWSEDPGYRQWAMQAPSCGGYVGCGPNYLERWWAKQANVALGDILADSRDIFSSGGFSDIGISGLNLAYLLRDHALEDGDIVQIRITQFGRVIYEGQVNLTNAGEVFDLMVGRGVASLEIFAVNEGYSSPNTAQITVENVVRGEATQTYSLQTGQTATLRIEAGAKPAPSTGTSGAGQ